MCSTDFCHLKRPLSISLHGRFLLLRMAMGRRNKYVQIFDSLLLQGWGMFTTEPPSRACRGINYQNGLICDWETASACSILLCHISYFCDRDWTSYAHIKLAIVSKLKLKFLIQAMQKPAQQMFFFIMWENMNYNYYILHLHTDGVLNTVSDTFY